MTIYISVFFKFFLRRALLVFLLSAVFFNSASVCAQAENISPATTFFSALSDLPIMQGMEELEEQTVFFDKPEGRIIESVAAMNNITEGEALEFYHATLPQMGWNRTSRNSFFRSGEYLEIAFENDGSENLMRIIIKPTL